MVVRPLLLVGLTALLSSVTTHAAAYCRTHTDDPQATSCPEKCKEQGLPLFWAKSHLTYAFNERGFPGLSSQELRSIIGSSFDAWKGVTCTGEPVGIQFSALGGTTPLQDGPRQSEPNPNVIAHLSEEEWDARSYDPRAYAITAVWFRPDNGEIMGADMLFNGGMDPFGVCSANGCMGSDPETDLRNVATHEIGHFLGLSHSDVPDSTMWCGAAPNEVSKRSLSLDDVAGLCDAYPPGDAFAKEQAVTRSSGGGSCAVAPGEMPKDSGSALWLLLAPAWLLARGARRRR